MSGSCGKHEFGPIDKSSKVSSNPQGLTEFVSQSYPSGPSGHGAPASGLANTS